MLEDGYYYKILYNNEVLLKGALPNSDYNYNNPDSFKASISKSTPYDLNENYVWARIGDGNPMSVKYIQNGRVIKTSQLELYDSDEDYRIAPDDILSERTQTFYDKIELSEQENIIKYYDYCLCEVFDELTKLNKGIKPIIDRT